MAKLSKGDEVTWKSHGGEAVGKVVKQITSETHAAGRRVKASQDEPQYLVKSDKRGGRLCTRRPLSSKTAKPK